MLKISALESFYGGQFTLSIQSIKPNYLAILPTNAAPQFLRNLPPLFIVHFTRKTHLTMESMCPVDLISRVYRTHKLIDRASALRQQNN